MKRHAPEKVSRARQRLGTLWEEAGRLLEVFRRDTTWKPGVVRLFRRKCGKTGCRCTRGELHTNWVLQWYGSEGQVLRRRVPEGSLTEWREQVEEHRRFRRARQRLGQIHREMLDSIRVLEAWRVEEVGNGPDGVRGEQGTGRRGVPAGGIRLRRRGERS